MKKRNVVFFAIASLGVSQIACYCILDDLSCRVIQGWHPWLQVMMRLSLAAVLTMAVSMAAGWRPARWLVHLMAAGWTMTLVWLSLNRAPMAEAVWSLDLRAIYRDEPPLVIANALVYLPTGVWVSWSGRGRLRLRDGAGVFLIGIVLVEGLQGFTRRGFFDLADIVLNTAGFTIGMWVFQVTGCHRLRRHSTETGHHL